MLVVVSHKVRKAAWDCLEHARRQDSRRLSTENHWCGVLDPSGRMMACAWNKAMTPSKGCGASAHTMHAEIAAIKRVGDLDHLANCVLVVARFTPGGALASSSPCAQCRRKLGKMFARYRLKGGSVHLINGGRLYP